MKRHRQTDYHGSRSYEADEPVFTQYSLMVAWLKSIAKNRMRNWRKFGARPTSPKAPGRVGKRGFSILGGDSLAKVRRRPADCPFPTGSNDVLNPRDWRVFP